MRDWFQISFGTSKRGAWKALWRQGEGLVVTRVSISLQLFITSVTALSVYKRHSSDSSEDSEAGGGLQT